MTFSDLYELAMREVSEDEVVRMINLGVDCEWM